MVEADRPLEKPKNPLPDLMLGRAANGSAILGGPAGGGYSLSLSPEGKIKAADFTVLGNNPGANTSESVSRWKLAPNGTLRHGVASRNGRAVRAGHWPPARAHSKRIPK